MFHNLFQKTVAYVGATPTSFGASTAVTSANIVKGTATGAIITVNHAAPTQTAGAGTPTGTLTLSFVDGPTTSPATAVTLTPTFTAGAVDIAAAGINQFYINLEKFDANFKITTTAALTASGGGNTPLCLASVDVLLGDWAVEPQPNAQTVFQKA